MMQFKDTHWEKAQGKYKYRHLGHWYIESTL